MEQLISLYENLVGEKPICTLLKGEGSNRKYYRLSSDNGSLIGVQGESINENKAFIALAKHFEKQHLNTPKVVSVSDDSLFYLQEDLGDVSLYQAITPDIKAHIFSDESRAILRKTISQLADFQFNAAKELDFSVCYPIPAMDKTSIMWDLNYFKYCFLKLMKVDFFEMSLEQDFNKLTDALLQYDSDTFLYRDFQSRNVMLKDGNPYFIDFQGGRRGPIFYDVASFIWQAKANYPVEVREELIQTYIGSLRKYQTVNEVTFKKTLTLFVLFRQLQVLGAYGYRGLFEGKEYFVESIPLAMKNIADLIANNDFSDYPYLISILKKLAEEYTSEKKELLDNTKLTVKVFSFSYKKGIPEDTSGNGGGYVFDCRGVHNPGKYEQYKPLTGMDQPVIDFLEQDGEILKFLGHIYALADAHVQRYMERGFTSLMLSFGCTGGRHRSVYSAEHVAAHIAQKFGVKVELCHREQNISKTYPAVL